MTLLYKDDDRFDEEEPKGMSRSELIRKCAKKYKVKELLTAYVMLAARNDVDLGGMDPNDLFKSVPEGTKHLINLVDKIEPEGNVASSNR